MFKVQSSFHYQQALSKTLLKQDSTGSRAAGADARARPVNNHTPAGIINESLEEIGMMFSEKMEKKTKGLQRRASNTQHLRSNRGAVERIEHLGELYQLLDDQQQDRLETRMEALKGILRDGGEQPDTEALVAASDNDPARCDVILRMALREADGAGDVHTASAIGRGLDSLHEKYGDQVRAGLNTASAIASFTTDATEKQAMRNMYYNGIVKHQSASVILDSLLERFGHSHFMPGLRTFQRALAEDIGALTPSLSSRSLHKIHLGLSEAGKLTNLIARSDAMLSRLRSGGKIPTTALAGIDMTRRLLGVAENGLQGREVSAIGKEYAGEEPQAQMMFFNGLLPVMNEMPATLWRDKNQRPEAMGLLRNVISMLIDNENKTAAKR